MPSERRRCTVAKTVLVSALAYESDSSAIAALLIWAVPTTRRRLAAEPDIPAPGRP